MPKFEVLIEYMRSSSHEAITVVDADTPEGAMEIVRNRVDDYILDAEERGNFTDAGAGGIDFTAVQEAKKTRKKVVVLDEEVDE